MFRLPIGRVVQPVLRLYYPALGTMDLQLFRKHRRRL